MVLLLENGLPASLIMDAAKGPLIKAVILDLDDALDCHPQEQSLRYGVDLP
jgi:hypothetical protein